MTTAERMIYAAAFVAEVNAHGPTKAADAAWGAVMTFRHASLPPPAQAPEIIAMWLDMKADRDGADERDRQFHAMVQVDADLRELRVKVAELELENTRLSAELDERDQNAMELGELRERDRRERE